MIVALTGANTPDAVVRAGCRHQGLDEAEDLRSPGL